MKRREFVAAAALRCLAAPGKARRTEVTIQGARFLLNSAPTYAGRRYKGMSIEGLLFNSRMVQGIFDDGNPETRRNWAYPDTGKWDPDRNTSEFIASMPEWRRHGLLSFSINLQGGNPKGYTRLQPWVNSAFGPEGELKPEYMRKLGRILDRADELGMAPVVGLFYFGQDHALRDEAAVKRGLRNAINWLFDRAYRNILIEVANECDVKRYSHEILTAPRIHELIQLAKAMRRDGRRFLTGASYGGGSVPQPNVVGCSDFLLMHGNHVEEPARIARMVAQARSVDGYRPMPILFNEDDHFDFDKPANNMMASIGAFASWGYFDPGENNYRDGYQSPPVNWQINTPRKKAFFAKVKEVTGA